MHDHIHGTPLINPPEVVGHQFCSRCKLLLKRCSFGLDCPNQAFIDDKLCRYCADDAQLLEAEDDEAFENDVAAYTRFHLHTAHLLDDAQRVRAERAGLKPWQLREHRRLRRAENSAVEEARVKEGCRDAWPLPGLGTPGDSAEYETACYELETQIYKRVREKEEELLEDWNDRRLHTGVVEPRPVLTWVPAMGDNQQPVWELDTLPPKQPPSSPAPPDPALFIPGLPLGPGGSMLHQQHEDTVVQEGAIGAFDMDYGNPSLPPEPADSTLYQEEAIEALDMDYGNQLSAPIPTDDTLLPTNMNTAASFLDGRDGMLPIAPDYSAIANSGDEISSLEAHIDGFRRDEQALEIGFDAGLNTEPELCHNEPDGSRYLSPASDIVG
ncbi:hypothetical protein DL769_004718 [Monosporascus sp. CRB-8-3]|nr:hypothetical protein DL769_004718 [Monosporascus sp. CRB-8-3]